MRGLRAHPVPQSAARPPAVRPACAASALTRTPRGRWRIFTSLNPSASLDPSLGMVATQATYPTSQSMEGAPPVTPASVFAVLRDHYEGTPFDLTKGPAAGPFGTPTRWGGGPNEKAVQVRSALPPPNSVPSSTGATISAQGGWERAISMHRTTWSYVVESRRAGPGIPAAAATRIWFAFDSPHASVYVPFYAQQDELPPSFDWALQCTFSRRRRAWRRRCPHTLSPPPSTAVPLGGLVGRATPTQWNPDPAARSGRPTL